MRTVRLNGRRAEGRVARVSDEDYELVSGYNWHIFYGTTSGPYAWGTPKGSGRGARKVLMHNLIMGAAGIDHEDHDGLNNQRSNLRPANHVQNAQNQRRHRDGSSRFKGVHWRKDTRRWQVKIQVNGEESYLGCYDDEEQAARVYDAAALKAFGEFACLNFPEACGERPEQLRIS